MAKQSFIDYFREQAGGMVVSGTQYKKIRSGWRKSIGYKSPVTKIKEFGEKEARKISGFKKPRRRSRKTFTARGGTVRKIPRIGKKAIKKVPKKWRMTSTGRMRIPRPPTLKRKQ